MSTEQPIHYVVTMTPIAGHEEALETALRELLGGVRANLAPTSYALHRTLDEPVKFVMIEEWPNQVAVDVYSSSAELKAFWAAMEGHIAGAPEVVGLKAVP